MPSAVSEQFGQIRFADQAQDTPYRLIRRQRKNIGLRVTVDGLAVLAAPHVPLTAIEATLQANAVWIMQQLQQFQHTATPPLILLQDGCEFPLLGKMCRLQLLPIQGAGRATARAIWQADFAQLTLLVKAQATATAIVKAFQQALQQRALSLFQARLDFYAPKMGLTTLPPLSLTAAKTRWGSCSPRGIRLHWQLIHSDLSLIDYVVVHELAHLREMNHSPNFWAIVAEFYPTWREARLALRDIAGKLPRFTAI